MFKILVLLLCSNHRSFLANWRPGLKGSVKEQSFNRGAISRASNSSSDSKLESRGEKNSGLGFGRSVGVEPFRGKSGSVSFVGLTHQLVEEAKLVSAPFSEAKGSFLWVLAPVVLISSLILPQFFLSNIIESFLVDVTLVGICFYLVVCYLHNVTLPFLLISLKAQS